MADLKFGHYMFVARRGDRADMGRSGASSLRRGPKSLTQECGFGGGRAWWLGGGGGLGGGGRGGIVGEEPAVGQVEDAVTVGGVFFGVGYLDDGGAGIV